MKYDNELKELNEFLLSKYDNDIELDIKLEKMINNSKFQLLIDRVLEIEQLKNGLLEFEINDIEKGKKQFEELLKKHHLQYNHNCPSKLKRIINAKVLTEK